MKQVIIEKRAGAVTYDKPLDYVLATLRNGRYVMTIKSVSEKRSLPQNDLMWLWMTCIERETGTPKEDVYNYYCRRFLSRPVTINERTEWVYETSSKLTVERMTEFLNLIQADAATELGITLPTPEDRLFEYFYNEYRK
jgi:hypothetical protein